jgi:putative RNA 2'-phosphotransferase
MDEHRRTKISKTLSYWLRHNPRAGGITLDSEGWASVSAVLAALESRIRPAVSIEELEAVVATNDKQRFALHGCRIRANQGHSVALEIAFKPVDPPPFLYHGTTHERWMRIQASGGLQKMQRHHVHLSPDVASARKVAERHRGERPLILRINASEAATAGQRFLLSENGVYLVDSVSLSFLSVADGVD